MSTNPKTDIWGKNYPQGPRNFRCSRQNPTIQMKRSSLFPERSRSLPRQGRAGSQEARFSLAFQDQVCLSEPQRRWAGRDMLLRAGARRVDTGTGGLFPSPGGKRVVPPHKVCKGFSSLCGDRGESADNTSVTHWCLMKAGRKPGESKLQVKNVQTLESPLKRSRLSHLTVCHSAELRGRRKGRV